MSKKDSIILSEKHGVNSSIIVCTLCGKDMGIALMGKLKDDAQAPKQVSIGEICADCIKQLEEDKVRCFVDLAKGRYIKIKDEDVSEEYLKKVGDVRWLPIPSDNFNEIFGEHIK